MYAAKIATIMFSIALAALTVFAFLDSKPLTWSDAEAALACGVFLGVLFGWPEKPKRSRRKLPDRI